MILSSSPTADPAVPLPGSPVAAQPVSLDLAQLAREMRLGRREATTPEQSLKNAARVALRCQDVAAIAIFRCDRSGVLQPVVPLLCQAPYVQQANAWKDSICRAAGAAAHSANVEYGICGGSTASTIIVAAPICIGSVCVGTVCLTITNASTLSSQHALMVQLIASEAAADSRFSPAVKKPSVASPDQTVDHRIELLLRALERDRTEDAYADLADGIRELVGMGTVYVGHRPSKWRGCRVQAISENRGWQPQSAPVQAAQAVLEEATLSGLPQAYQRSQHDHPDVTTAMRTLAETTGAEMIVAFPFADSHRDCHGAWLITLASQVPSETTVDRIVAAAHPLTQTLSRGVSLIERARPSALGRLWATLWGESTAGSKRTRLLLAAATLTGILCVPMPYRVACDSIIQPVTRRYIPVPYDGLLKEVLVEPGDEVVVGQVLAQMDEREIQWKLTSKRAERKRAQKNHDASLAKGETAEAQVAAFEAEQLAADIELLENHARNLEIKSPINGVVITGDPKKHEGASFTIGQNLFEISPLDQMLVEVLVPEEDIAHVSEGQSLRLRLEAEPLNVRRGTIRRVSPQSETRDHKNVFVAEVALDNHDHMLRPGMAGRGRVKTDWHALGWNLFHKPAQSIFYYLGW